MLPKRKYFSCLDHIKSAGKPVFIFDNTEAPPPVESKKRTAGETGETRNLDDAASSENKKLAERFKEQFKDKIRGDKLELTQNKNGVDYRYIFKLHEDEVTVTVTRINESERKEKGSDAPAPLKRTVTYSRLYADKVVGMPGLKTILEENKAREAAEPAPATAASLDVEKWGVEDEKKENEGKKKGRLQLEAGMMIPKSNTTTSADGTAYEELGRSGGAGTVRYIMTNPDKNTHLAFTLPVHFDVGARTNVSNRPGSTIVEDSAEYNLRLGAGLEAGVSLAEFMTLYGGAALIAEGRYTDMTTTAVQQGVPSISDSTNTTVKPGAQLSAGVRVNPIQQWHLYAAVQPTRTFTSAGSWDIPVIVGTGFTF